MFLSLFQPRLVLGIFFYPPMDTPGGVDNKVGCSINPVGTAVSLTGTVVAHETHPFLPALRLEWRIPPGLIPA